MAIYRCGLCSHDYDESAEGVPFADLSDDWTCPVCGSEGDVFSPVSKSAAAETTPGGSDTTLQVYRCGLCSHEYDEAVEAVRFEELPGDWVCPLCGSPKSEFSPVEGRETAVEATPVAAATAGEVSSEYLAEWHRPADEVETHMADIHQMATTGHEVIEPMRTRVPSFSWNEILIKGAQLSRLPLNRSQPVSTRTVLGPSAAHPLVVETPLLITHMSYGALSREAKIALARGSAVVHAGMCSGEGGILPESIDGAHAYIFEYVPNKYSVTDEYLQRVDAVEIKFGQSAKPGMGGHLPGNKVTEEIARIRGFRQGVDIISPSHFPDIRDATSLRRVVDELRTRTEGKPVGVKFAAGDIEGDLAVALEAGIDFITIDGRAGATGAAPKFVKLATSVPTIFALSRARRFLDANGAGHVSLIITGGFRISADFAKALALGADAIALGSAAMMALGCQQYRICNTGRCPVGIATQDPALRARFDIDKSAARVANFLRVSTEELQDFARLTGHERVKDLCVTDLCTTNSEISGHTPVEHV